MEEVQALDCVSLGVSMALTARTRVAASGASVATNPLGAVDRTPPPVHMTKPQPPPRVGGLAGGPMGGGWGEMRSSGWGPHGGNGALVRRGETRVVSLPGEDSAKGPWTSQGETPRHPIGQHLPLGRPASG